MIGDCEEKFGRVPKSLSEAKPGLMGKCRHTSGSSFFFPLFDGFVLQLSVCACAGRWLQRVFRWRGDLTNPLGDMNTMIRVCAQGILELVKLKIRNTLCV